MQNKDKVALVAGVENPVGAAVAKKMKKSGWKVVGVDILPKTGLAGDLDEYISLDMTRPEKVPGSGRRSSAKIRGDRCALLRHRL